MTYEDAAAPLAAPAPDPASRSTRRHLITRALLRDVPESRDPTHKLFHFEQEMTEQFAKSRLSSYAVIPALVLSMGIAIAVLGNPYLAIAWVTVILAIHALVLSAARRFLREGLAKATLHVWKRRFVQRDFAYGLAWALFPLLLPASGDAKIATGLAIIRLAAVIVVLSVGALLSSPIPAAAVAATLPIALCMAAVHVMEPTFFNIMIALCVLTAEMLFLTSPAISTTSTRRTWWCAPKRMRSSPSWSRPRPCPTRRGAAPRRPTWRNRSSSPP